MMQEFIMSCLTLSMGLWFLLFHKALGQKTSEFWYSMLRKRFDKKVYQATFLIAGAIFIIVSLLKLLLLQGKS